MVFRRQLVEVFERGDATRCLLDFVEDDERVCWRYGLAAQELYLGDDAFGGSRLPSNSERAPGSSIKSKRMTF